MFSFKQNKSEAGALDIRLKRTPVWKTLEGLFHLAVLAGAFVLIVYLTSDTLHHVSLQASHTYMKLQLAVCMFMLLDVIIEYRSGSRDKMRKALFAMFALIAIPWLNIFSWFHFTVTGEFAYVLRLLPVLRACYIFAVVSVWYSSNRISGILTGYIAFMIMVVYFGSMMFYVEEHGVNPMVTSYPQAIWWAVMNMTTAGCNINEYTITGKILSTLLSGCGIMFFPVFTVYVTNALSKPLSHPDIKTTDNRPNAKAAQ